MQNYIVVSKRLTVINGIDQRSKLTTVVRRSQLPQCGTTTWSLGRALPNGLRPVAWPHGWITANQTGPWASLVRWHAPDMIIYPPSKMSLGLHQHDEAPNSLGQHTKSLTNNQQHKANTQGPSTSVSIQKGPQSPWLYSPRPIPKWPRQPPRPTVTHNYIHSKLLRVPLPKLFAVFWFPSFGCFLSIFPRFGSNFLNY